MIIGYIYSQKCNENAKKKRFIYFDLQKNFFVYILKKGYQNSQCNNPVQFSIFITLLTINIANDHSKKSSFQPVQSFQRLITYTVVQLCTQGSDFVRSFGDWTQSKKLSQTQLPLIHLKKPLRQLITMMSLIKSLIKSLKIRV